MQMHRARQLDYRQSSFCYEERFVDRENNYRRSPPPLPASTTFAAGASFIEHHVSKFDTLAGIAIKYGVEVADIKKMNGLASDIQIFALRSIQIPLPGRHTPSPSCCLSDASTPAVSPSSSSQKTSFDLSSDFLDSFQPSKPRASTHKLSAAMTSLQSYYGLQCDVDQKPAAPSGGSTDSATSCPPPKSKTIANGFADDDDNNATTEVAAAAAATADHPDHAVRRRQKSEADVTSGTTELVLREDNNATSGSAFASITGKCLALRSNTKPTLISDDVQTDHNFDDNMSGWNNVRKCPSISSLHEDHESSSLASLWAASKWPDLQVLTTAAIARPIFDGIQKPVNIWRNKTAVD